MKKFLRSILFAFVLFVSYTAQGQQDYVFYNADYGYLINNNGNPGVSTTFTKSAIWVASNTLGNTSRYIYSYSANSNYLTRSGTSLGFANTASTYWRTTNNYLRYRVSNTNNYYLKYTGTAFDLSNTQQNGNLFTATAITINTSNTTSNPTLSITAENGLTGGGIQLTPSITGTYRPAYSYATVRNYNNATTQTYYWTSTTEASTTQPVISDWSDATLNWEVTTGGAYASVNSDGLVTITANPTGNVVVTLTVTKGDYEGTQTYTLTRAAAAAGSQIVTEISQPTVNPVSAALYYNEGSQTFTTSATATRSELSVPAYTTLSASGNTYYYYNGNLYASAGDFGTPTITYPEVTISWALSGDAASYLTRTPATGTSTSVTHTSQSPSDLTATLTVTASAAGAASKTATATITAYGPMEAPTISRTGNSISLATASAGATIYYTTDGSTPTADNGTAYAGPFDLVTSPTTVKAIAIRDGHSSTVTDESFSIILAAPTISVSNTGLATITADDGATIHYTTDGSTPTAESAIYSSAVQLTNPQTIKAIAVRTGYTTSDVSTGDYITTGVSGNTVILDDREDHTWTYYSEKPDADYPNALRSPNPRNVKITYRATDNGTPRNTSGNAISGASAVAVSATESANTFVYYKTIEQYAWGLDPNGNGSVGRWLTGEYAYRTIPNPFSKRPATGIGGGKVYYGFAGWKVISGGNYISEYADGSIIPADQLIHFVGLPAGNDGNGEIVLEAVWTQATVTAVNDNVSGNPNDAFTGGTFETNFVVVSGSGRTISGLAYNVTVMGCYPDGTGATGASLGDVTGSSNDLVIESINLGNAGNDFTANTGWLIVGRGCTGNVRRVIGNIGQIKIRIESGLYNFINPMSGGSPNDANYGRIIFGNDYDRATNDGLTSNDQYEDNSSRRKLRVINYVSFNGSGAAKSSNDNQDEWMDITIKSGYYGFSADYSKFVSGSLNANNQDGMGLGIGGNTDAFKEAYTTYNRENEQITYNFTNWNVVNQTDYRWQKLFSFYCGRTRGGNSGGVNRVLVEGGELCSLNGGGYKNNQNNVISYHLRVKGGWIKGAVYGTASASQTSATTKQVITGGEINGWIAGACNGTDVRIENGTNYTGDNNGNTFLYIGGNAEVRSHLRDGKYNNAWGLVGNVEGGNVFAAGRGNYVGDANAALTYSGSSDNTYLVVADNSQIEQNVSGGGYIGIAHNSHIYLMGGIVGKNVYGGTMTPRSLSSSWYAQTADIRMFGGTVKGGIYGGHYEGSGNGGKIQQDVSVAVYGGIVGEGDTGDGVFGGGYGAGTGVGGDVSVTLGACDAESGATVFGDVYGGSALGTVNDATSDKTTVSLYKGTIYGGLYGGGYGPGGVAGSGSVFGCNNAGGAPQSTVTVDIYNTDQPASGYALHAVYGGGNQSPYSNTPVVTIHGCSNSIEYVYGGGNATDVLGTDVTIWGGTIGSAFGGGNGAGAGNPGANITANGTNLVIHGGTIGSVFGGSNEKGKISSSVNVTISGARELDEDPCTHTAYTECPMEINEMYSGGNKAELRDMDNNWITPDNINVSTDCSTKINYLFGGARMADYGGGDITLTVNGGVYRQIFGGNNLDGEISGNVTVNFLGGKADDIFGGNNLGGTVLGTITVNIDSTENTCTPHFYVENVYGGGNEAEYSHAAGNYPEVNVKNGTVQQDVYGGGLGAGATVTGSPKVTVGVSDTGKKALVLGNVFGGGNAASVSGDTRVNIMYNTYIKGNVYGGGNAAPVSGNTKVVVGE